MRLWLFTALVAGWWRFCTQRWAIVHSQLHIQWGHIGSLKSVTANVFIPWELANSMKQCFPPPPPPGGSGCLTVSSPPLTITLETDSFIFCLYWLKRARVWGPPDCTYSESTYWRTWSRGLRYYHYCPGSNDSGIASTWNFYLPPERLNHWSNFSSTKFLSHLVAISLLSLILCFRVSTRGLGEAAERSVIVCARGSEEFPCSYRGEKTEEFIAHGE